MTNCLILFARKVGERGYFQNGNNHVKGQLKAEINSTNGGRHAD